MSAIKLHKDAEGRVTAWTDTRWGKAERYSFDDPLWKPYLTCWVCGKPLSEFSVEVALLHFIRQTCSAQCSMREQVCCEKAVLTPCVCHLSWKCPDHYPNGTHIGTHD